MAPEDDDGNAASKRAAPASMAPGVLADWISHIESSVNGAEFKARVADAEAACKEINDTQALSKIQAAAATMAARVKPKALTTA
jgi:hypothetical protein